MKFFLVQIAHDTTSDRTYTFRSSSHIKIGELAICKNRFGYTYGIVTGITRTSYKEAKKYAGVAAKANKHMLAKLPTYDRAVIILKNTGSLEDAMNQFGFTDKKAAEAFLYNEVGASYVSVNNDGGDIFISLYEDSYDENGEWDGLVLFSSFCLG